MVRTCPIRWPCRLTLAVLTLAGVGGATAAIESDPRDAASTHVAASPMFPDDAVFTAAPVEQSLTALVVKSVDVIGMDFAGTFSCPIHSPNQTGGDRHSGAVALLPIFADQNLRLRI